MTRPMTRALLTISCWCVAGTGWAQYTGALGMTFNNSGSAFISHLVSNAAFAQSFRKQLCTDAVRKGQPVPDECTAKDLAGAQREAPARAAETRYAGRAPAPRQVPLTFRPSGGRVAVDELAGLFASAGSVTKGEWVGNLEAILDGVEAEARRQGQPSNDVGSAIALFIVLNYGTATGQVVDERLSDAIEAQGRAVLAANDAFAVMGDRERQRAYETAILLAVVPAVGVEQARRDSDRQAEGNFRDLAKLNIESFLGVSLDRLALTSDGVQLKGR